MLPFLIGGAALGVGSHLSKQAQAERDRKVQSATTRYSPWTGMVAKAPEDSNLFGQLLQGGLTGAMVGQGYEQLAANAAPTSPTAGGTWKSLLGVDTNMPEMYSPYGSIIKRY